MSQEILQEALKTAPPNLPSAGLGDSKTALLDDMLLEKLEDIFHRPPEELRIEEVVQIAAEYSPIDLAYAVCGLPPQHRAVVYEHLKNLEAQIEFISAAEADTRRAVLRELSDTQVRKLLEAMPVDEAVCIIDELSERRVRRILPLIGSKRAAQIRERVSHERGTAARLMSSEFFSFDPETSVEGAAAHIRKNPGIDCVRSLFVTEGEVLLGMVSARALIIHPPKRLLKEIMRPVFHQVDPDTPREEIIEIIERYKIGVLPVVENGKICGVITQEDALDALEDITDETLARMAGTMEKVAAHHSTVRRFFARAPWLVITLIAGLINMEVMTYFGHTFHYLMYFVPMITGLSGNIGLQCSTVLVRGIALGQVTSKNQWKYCSKEIIVGLCTGIVFGALCGLIIYGLGCAGLHADLIGPVAIGVIVSGGLFSACIAATLLGVFAPVLFARFGIDPAVASGPIITAINDFLSMVIYFTIASILSIALLG